jgi:hypothetical protein
MAGILVVDVVEIKAKHTTRLTLQKEPISAIGHVMS